MASDGNINNNHNGHANRNEAWGKIGKESFGLLIAEGVSIGVSLGVVGLADTIAPNLLKSCSKTLGKVILPYLDNIEGGLKRVCKLEECQPDLNQPREQRSERLARTMIVFSSAWATSMAAKLATRKFINEKLGITKPAPRTGKWYKDAYNDFLRPTEHDKHVFYWDEGVHYGSLILMNTGAAKFTDDMIRATSNMLQQCGMSKQKANEMAAMGMIWEVPNALGWLAGVGKIAHHHFHNSHVEKLAQQTALSSTIPTLHT